MSFELTSPAIQDGQPIPKEYTSDGRNASPPLKWRDVPDGTNGFALICDDPGAPRGTCTHWVLYDLPAQCRELGKGCPAESTLPDGTAQGTNNFGHPGYGGQSPPRGKSRHYVFKLYTLDQPVDLR